MRKWILAFNVTALLLLILAIGFLVSAGLTWVISWAFDFTFTWKIAIGVWVVISILGTIFRTGRGR